METRSNHVLVGGVVIALLALLLVFLIWLARLSGGDDHPYDIFFKEVGGLAKGSPVQFSGVPVGQVSEIALMADQPEFVRVRISVRSDVAVLQGTTATIEGIGFTGVSQVQLDGAVKGAAPITCPEPNTLAACPYGVPVIPTKPGALGQLLNSAPLLLERLSTLTERLNELLGDDNQRSIGGILRNVERLSQSLAARGPEIAATLAETRVAVRQAGEAAQQIGQLAGTTNQMVASDVRPLVANLNRTVAAAERSMTSLDAAMTEARPGLRAFSTQTIPEISQLVRDLSEMSSALTAVASRLDSGGAGAVLRGNNLPDYEPK